MLLQYDGSALTVLFELTDFHGNRPARALLNMDASSILIGGDQGGSLLLGALHAFMFLSNSNIKGLLLNVDVNSRSITQERQLDAVKTTRCASTP